MKTYKAVIFDLFDTLVDFDRALIPTVTIDGREVRTTAGETYKVLAAHATALTFDTYYRTLQRDQQGIAGGTGARSSRNPGAPAL